jgi:hypothetical protein
MNSEYIPIVTTLISVAGSLLVAYGTWTVQMKQARQKEHDEIVRLLEEHKNDTELQIKLIQKDIQTLSDRVEKHNGVLERTILLEQKTAVQEEQIKVANHRIDDLERK